MKITRLPLELETKFPKENNKLIVVVSLMLTQITHNTLYLI